MTSKTADSGPLSGRRRGLMLVLSSPSGAGKSTLARLLMKGDPGIALSISVTTRAPRPDEIEGVHYNFVDRARFEELRDSGELLEWAHVFGNFYGTPRRPIEEALASGRDVLFDIDWQGAQQLSQKAPADLVRIFVLPPSGRELHERLERRAQDSAEVMARRMAEAASELSHWAEYDYVVVNCDLDSCLGEIRTILAAERLRRERRPHLSDFVRALLGEL